MRRVLTDGGPGTEFWEQFTSFERSAWRFEQQPAYYLGYEREQFNRFLADDPAPPDENPDLRDWFAQTRHQVAEGKTIGRVRIIDEPTTDYQRWMQWMDRWNRDAGETIQYLTRAAARAAGLPVDGGNDWWLFDDQRLMLMHFDSEYRRIKVELLEGEPEVEQARRWRETAIAAAQDDCTAKA
jgi:hypothetical protein